MSARAARARDQARSPRYPIGSVDNALQLLLMFQRERVVGVSQAARDLGVAPSTAHRLLAMLCQYDFVRQDPVTQAYGAGPALINVGLAVVRDLDVRRLGRAHLERLTADLQETSHAVTLDGPYALFLDAVEADQVVRTSARIGTRLPATCTAGGKALLARLEPDRLRALFERERLAQLTPQSIATWTELEADLERVRQTGYAVNRGESEVGLWAVAAATLSDGLVPPAALAVSAPTIRADQTWVNGAGALVAEAARSLSEDLAAAARPAGGDNVD